MTLPRIGITIGDPGGVGPEIVLKAWSGDYQLPAADYVLFHPGPCSRGGESPGRPFI
jgi:4-hydroxy-L-threonine phosphate dehydrogenase PdxA